MNRTQHAGFKSSEFDPRDAKPNGGAKPSLILQRLDKLVISTTVNYLIRGWLPRVGLGVILGLVQIRQIVRRARHGAVYRARPRVSRQALRCKSGPVVSSRWRAAAAIPNASRRGTASTTSRSATRRSICSATCSSIYSRTAPRSLWRSASKLPRRRSRSLSIRSTARSRAARQAGGHGALCPRLRRAAYRLSLFRWCRAPFRRRGNDRPRGHTSLAGADDVGIAVSRDPSGLILMHVDHVRDDAPAGDLSFGLETIQVATNDEGDAIISAAVVALTSAAKRRRSSPATTRLRTIFWLN